MIGIVILSFFFYISYYSNYALPCTFSPLTWRRFFFIKMMTYSLLIIRSVPWFFWGGKTGGAGYSFVMNNLRRLS